MHTLPWLAFFGWATVINWLVLLCWFLMVTLGRQWVFGVHQKLFGIPEQQLASLHYGGMMAYKLLVLLLFAVPYVVLRFFITV